MKLDELNKLQLWNLQGFVALYLWSSDRLALGCAASTLAIFLYPALLIKDSFGVGGAFFFIFACYFLTAKYIGFWIVNPLCGLFILERAQRSYGPITRRKILEWVFEQGGDSAKKTLNIAALARANGEYK